MEEPVESVELDLLLQGVFQRYGYDFRGYARPSVARQVDRALKLERLGTVSQLQGHLLRDAEAMTRFTQTMTVNVTSMFRDPKFFLAFRRYAVPVLHTYPFLRLWIAGCSTGEEAYSLAILLHEEGLLQKSRIYATDMSHENIQLAKLGIFPLAKMQDYTRFYQRSGGTEDFSKYYTAKFDQAIFAKTLGKKIAFAQHNLASDSSFNEFHVVICRNVMIYFDMELQERVMHLLHDSLGSLGFLCLGTHEAIFPVSLREEFQELEDGTRLFRART